jgi:ATP-dependent DNA helicase RecQ
LVQCLAAGDIELDELVDRHRQQIIADAIEKAQSERLKPVKEILGEDFSYGEIRYVMAGQTYGIAREDSEE